MPTFKKVKDIMNEAKSGKVKIEGVYKSYDYGKNGAIIIPFDKSQDTSDPAINALFLKIQKLVK